MPTRLWLANWRQLNEDSKKGRNITLTPQDAGILKVSTVLCEQVRVVDKTRLKKKLGEVVNRSKIEDINKKLMISIGIGV